MFENRYKKAYSTITPSQELIADTIDKANAGSKPPDRNQIAVKVSLAAAAAVLCFAVAVPVFAAQIPAFYKIVDYLSPEMADRLVPIEKSCTSHGITMHVEAVNL